MKIIKKEYNSFFFKEKPDRMLAIYVNYQPEGYSDISIMNKLMKQQSNV